MSSHAVLAGKVQIYKRPKSRFWQCSASIKGQQYRESTKLESLSEAKEFAEDWFLTLHGQARAGLLKNKEKTFRQAAEKFEKEYEIITEGQRSPRWVSGHKDRLRLHLLPFFGEFGLSEVTAGKVQDYRVHRAKNPYIRPKKKKKPDAEQSGPPPADQKPEPVKPPARSTIHDEIVTIRQVLKTAIRHGWLAHLPDLSPPYKTQGKVGHRAWFSPEEYKDLYEATRRYARKPFRKRDQWNARQVHDYLLLLANSGLRPDEAKNLQHRDVKIIVDEATAERILLIEVRGKRGLGYCKSMPNAVRPYERLLARALPDKAKDGAAENAEAPKSYPQSHDPVFPGNHIKLFNGILKRTGLKFDRDGNRRTAYSLRHSYICFRLLEGADPWAIAKNCRTSVEMIEKFYAVHIANALDASAINVRRHRLKSVEAPSLDPVNEDDLVRQRFSHKGSSPTPSAVFSRER
jgi:integrase